MRDYIRILTKIRETPWLITEEGLQVILAIVEERMNNGRLSEEELAIRLQSSSEEKPEFRNGRVVAHSVGVLPLMGPIFGKANLMTEMSGATSLETFSSDLAMMLADDNISSVLLHIDSPGGTSDGVKEVADQIYAARDTKPIYALADSMAGSAAYYLASQANELYATHSGLVGSIGVYTVHEDKSVADAQSGVKYTFISSGKYKTEGNEHQPLTDEAKAYRQEMIDEIYAGFVSDVARGRMVDVESVEDNYGKGRVVSSTKALDNGMIDGISTFDSLVNHIAGQSRQVQVMFDPTSSVVPASATTTNSSTVPNMGISPQLWSGSLIGNTVTISTTTNPLPVQMESKELEHSEPGTGSPPQPRTDEDGHDDIAITQRWRRDPLPVFGEGAPSPHPPRPNSNARGEGMAITSEQVEALRIKLGCGEDTFYDELLVAVEGYRDLQTSLSAASEEDRLQREYPQMWKEHQDLLNERRETRARSFTDTVKTFTVMEGESLKPSSFGLSALAMEYVTQMHLKFAEGTANLEDFENCIKGITQGGFVEYGERGSARTRDTDFGSYDTATAEGVRNVRQIFAAKVTEIQKQDNLEFKAALTEAAKRYPELAQAYQQAVPTSSGN